MTETSPGAQPVENVGRGIAFSIGAVLIAIVGFGVLNGLIGIYGWITGLVAMMIPVVGGALYEKGAGRSPKAGALPWTFVMSVAVLLGSATSFFATALFRFGEVGGRDALNNPAFWTTLMRQTRDFESWLPAIIALVVGVVGIVAVLSRERQQKKQAELARLAEARANRAAPPAAAPPADSPPAATPLAPQAPPVQAPSSATPLNAPSSGIVLNGQPLDPGAR